MKYAVAYIDLNEGSDGLPKVHNVLFDSVESAKGFIVLDTINICDCYLIDDDSVNISWKGLNCEVTMDDIHSIYNICEVVV